MALLAAKALLRNFFFLMTFASGIFSAPDTPLLRNKLQILSMKYSL